MYHAITVHSFVILTLTGTVLNSLVFDARCVVVLQVEFLYLIPVTNPLLDCDVF